MKSIYTKVADMIFEREALKFGAFKLKLHEKNPDAPLSPFYFNLRNKDNPTNPGPLLLEDYELIGKVLWLTIDKYNIDFEALAGLPHAADPIIEGMEKTKPKTKNFRIIKLFKLVSKDMRRIVPSPGFDYRKGEIILPVDDLVTGAHSKIEAIKAIESEGSVVKKLLVLIDREQGGRDELRKAGYELFSSFKITELLDYYKSSGRININKYLECLHYIKNSK